MGNRNYPKTNDGNVLRVAQGSRFVMLRVLSPERSVNNWVALVKNLKAPHRVARLAYSEEMPSEVY